MPTAKGNKLVKLSENVARHFWGDAPHSLVQFNQVT
jgi:hypothetical protein